MKVFLITYDLKLPGRDYSALYDAIKRTGSWYHPLESTWVVKTMNYIRAKDIYDIIIRETDANDSLFVVDITKQDYEGWLPKGFWEWLKVDFYD